MNQQAWPIPMGSEPGVDGVEARSMGDDARVRPQHEQAGEMAWRYECGSKPTGDTGEMAWRDDFRAMPKGHQAGEGAKRVEGGALSMGHRAGEIAKRDDVRALQSGHQAGDGANRDDVGAMPRSHQLGERATRDESGAMSMRDQASERVNRKECEETSMCGGSRHGEERTTRGVGRARGRTPGLGEMRQALVVERRAARARRIAGVLADEVALAAGSFEVRSARVNLVPLVARVVGQVRARAPRHRIVLSMPQGLTATVDAGRIEQVLGTLIEVLLRRTPRGGWIDVDLTRPLSGLARLEVRDYAAGALTEEFELDGWAGEPGVTKDEPGTAAARREVSRRELRVARAILELHGGSLVIEALAEGGVRLVASLPTQQRRSTGGS
jgi:hypothetical protein